VLDELACVADDGEQGDSGQEAEERGGFLGRARRIFGAKVG
jgi:hypothetical protein